MMQFRLFILFACLFTVFSAENVNAVVSCTDFPDCKSLGFNKTKSYCRENGFSYIECPFNRDLLYCPGRCEDYPDKYLLDECDDQVGKCKQCAIGGKWVYTECHKSKGYVFNETNGKCESILNSCPDYVEGKLDTRKGIISICTRGTISLYRYGDCNEGWELKNGDCVKNTCADKYDKLGYTSETCPNNVSCDTCKEGLVTKTKMTCPDGLFLQPKGDIAGEDYKCRKHLIGNIALYCKDKNKIPDGLDTDGDQIISLEADKYDTKPDDCEPIGVVFYNDDANGDGIFDYKIVGLKNIGYDSTWGFNIGGSAAWSTCAKDEAVCNVKNLVDGYTSVSRDGEENTNEIIDWVNSFLDEDGNPVTVYKAPAAQATRAYYPMINNKYDAPVCEKDTACGEGKWYLPSAYEMSNFFTRHYSILGLVGNALRKVNGALGGGVQNYHCSNERSNYSIVVAQKQNNGPNIAEGSHVEKTRELLVRPVLKIK